MATFAPTVPTQVVEGVLYIRKQDHRPVFHEGIGGVGVRGGSYYKDRQNFNRNLLKIRPAVRELDNEQWISLLDVFTAVPDATWNTNEATLLFKQHVEEFMAAKLAEQGNRSPQRAVRSTATAAAAPPPAAPPGPAGAAAAAPTPWARRPSPKYVDSSSHV